MRTYCYCVLTDGQLVADKREMDANELVRLNEQCKQSTDGNWGWAIDQSQSGLIDFDVVVSNADGSCHTAFTTRGPSSEFIKSVYSSDWRFVNVSPVQS